MQVKRYEVAIPTPVHGTFSYLSAEDIDPGTRVVVPFGKRKLVGVVVAPSIIKDENPAGKAITLKHIEDVIDDQPVFSQVMLQIALWLGKYYIHPLGDVFRTMLPASTQKKSKEGFYLVAEADEIARNPQLQQLASLFDKKDVIPPKSFAKAITKLQQKNADPDFTAEHFVAKGFLRFGKRTHYDAREQHVQQEASAPIDLVAVAKKALTLKGVQAEVFKSLLEQGIKADPKQRKPFLLRGVTGSGKTEVYLQTIAAALTNEPSRNDVLPQTLVLVPEISLTPQMTRIFADRFSDKVAVVHSAMSDEARWQQLDRIRTGDALVLIGPRSAVFGPFANLRLIIVDEEHDSSYKQQSGLLYHGRDVAILRAKLEGATVLLGSATPSLESYEHAVSGKYHLLQMPERVSGLALPEVHMISSKPAYNFGEVISLERLNPLRGGQEISVPIDAQIIEELTKNIAAKQQSIVLVNRRGFAYYLFSLKHKRAVPCPNCSISLTLHRRSTMMHCHYCDYRMSTAQMIKDNPDDTFVAVGYGSEKLEQMLQQALPEARIVRLDSDTAARKDVLPETLQKFRAGEIDILVGTQILAKGHDFPNVTLMVILDVDQLLDLPDFRSSERTFQLIVQAAGRAGRAELPGRVFIQCSRTDDLTIQSALKQDFVGFAERELEMRKASRYPPYQRMVHIELSSSDAKELEEFSQRVVRWLESFAKQEPQIPNLVRIMGPATPAIEIVRKRFRRSLILSSGRPDAMWHLANAIQVAFAKAGGDLRLKIDVDPQSLV